MHASRPSSSGGAVPPPKPEAILDWLQNEMGYQASLPSPDLLRRVCRGNMVPVWSFLLQRVRSDRTVDTLRRNIQVHGIMGRGGGPGGDEKRAAVRERDAAAAEVERLRAVVQRKRKELRAKMADVAREEGERKRVLDDRSSTRHKQVMLEAYDQQCDEAVKIFSEYQKRLNYYVNLARDAQNSNASSAIDSSDSSDVLTEKETLYSTVKGNKSLDDVLLIETSRERNIRKACESLASYLIEKIRSMFPAYEGTGIHQNPHIDASKLGSEPDGEIPDEVKGVIIDCLKNPPLLLQALSTYTLRVKSLIHRETEKIDVRADAELLRYKYENDRVTDDSSDPSSPLQYQVFGNGSGGSDSLTRGTYSQLLERQKAHVQQFVDTEDALNKAAKAKSLTQNLVKRLHGGSDAITSQTVIVGGTSQSLGTIRHFELDVWAKEREAAGLRASLNTLTSEVERLHKLCTEWKQAEDSLKKKWKKIEEFDARRTELESIYSSLLQANKDASSFWDQQPLAAREYALKTIIPACAAVIDLSNRAKDLIDKEGSAFGRSLDSCPYMLPSTPQALLEYMGTNRSTGPEAIAAAEKNASLLTSRAGAGDPSAIPSVCRISAALNAQSSSDTGLTSILESLEFCLKLRGSEASVLEELSKAINLVSIRRDLVENDRVLLNHADRVRNEYERTVTYCLKLAADQEKLVTERWLPELKTAVVDAQNCLEECRRVRGLVDEWWEQPAATIIDWVTVDGQNVAAWLNLVKQLQMAFYDQNLHP